MVWDKKDLLKENTLEIFQSSFVLILPRLVYCHKLLLFCNYYIIIIILPHTPDGYYEAVTYLNYKYVYVYIILTKMPSFDQQKFNKIK